MSAVITVLTFGRSWEDRSGSVYMTDPGVKIEAPFNAAAVEAGGKKILVDTGIDSIETFAGYAPSSQEPSETLEGALAIVGWRPEDVDIVINTHLHLDHCGLNSRLPGARFIVQKAEWEDAHNPIQTQTSIYIPDLYDPPAVDPAAWLFVEGEYEVAPGVRVIPTPGHTMGHQSVVVETDEGRVVYAGDIVNLMDNISKDIPPGIIIDVRVALQSLDRVRKAGDFVIPSHDIIVKPGQNANFPPMPPKPETQAHIHMG
jgi:N-acyl homoserine lactone hydrolase